MWVGHLGRVKATHHRIKLSPEHTRPIHTAAYRAVLKAWEFEKNDIHKILELKSLSRPKSIVHRLLSQTRRKTAPSNAVLTIENIMQQLGVILVPWYLWKRASTGRATQRFFLPWRRRVAPCKAKLPMERKQNPWLCHIMDCFRSPLDGLDCNTHCPHFNGHLAVWTTLWYF